mmetsp:Transcript_64331/g.106923  ORF Transcript_64331/g.106923 Transcript_64331/m.106923 type:complete len:343 (-) Transcript_64331:96-1124(-)|eukprot:CAMPEP_0119314464 /NCGR_PEP_ID=MMETSP1333-20130426/32841_1 /TAXON_ID=418940 /ORGANISM="Scyphosphaera apsteinii, Strain RCC1455" /LENGTH=342 /DNA_ID=CAMNT_0007319575 /DNA_START=56 /DNA_END=1084 /DNA_ORIENTATION=+
MTCPYRPGNYCEVSPLPDGALLPWGNPPVTCGFIITQHNVTHYFWPRWEERGHGIALLVQRAARILQREREIQGEVDVWIHVADVGRPELPLPLHPSGLTISTVARRRTDAADLFPDYSFGAWPRIGYNYDTSWSEFQSTLVRAGLRPTRRRLRRPAIFVGDATLHPVRQLLLKMTRSSAAARSLIDVRDVPLDAGRAGAPFVPFEALSEWETILDLPGGGWSGRLKLLPLLGRPLIVVLRDAWGWADGAVLQPFVHYRPVNATTDGDWRRATFLFDPDDLFAEVQWCRENPIEAAAMAQRARRHALSAFAEEAIDAQAAHVLRRAMIEAGHASRHISKGEL